MRFFKITALIILLLFGLYTAAMYYLVEESKKFTIEKEINYPVDKVYRQFSNFQNFTRWNNFFSSSKNIRIDYYQPYEGKGSAITYTDPSTEQSGEMYIRYANDLKTLRYQLFERENENPTLIDVKFTPVSATKTKIKWFIHTPKLSVWTRARNFWTKDRFAENIDKSMANLTAVLGNKIQKDNLLAAIKYDSLMVEKQDAQMILGISVSASNKKDALAKNIIINYNKVYNFTTMDLGKKNDEIGYPVLIMDPDNLKDKEVSYFIGIPVSKKEGITDNNFSFRSVNPSENYVIYYRGNPAGSTKAIQRLREKASKDEMRYGEIFQTYLEAPTASDEINVKLSLSIYR